MNVGFIKWQVVNYDWDSVIAEFQEHSNAEAFAEHMDGLACRCYVRPVRDIKRELLNNLEGVGD